MRIFVTALLWVAAWGCAPSDRNGNGDAPPMPDACSGLGCKIVDCAKKGLPSTTVSGTVFAPNGTLALFGVSVYVPASFPTAFSEGASCTRCEELSGGVVVKTVSDEAGRFVLTDVPVGDNIPLVITIGKWRKMMTIPRVTECSDNQLPAGMAALPRTRSEGDIPKIAVTTGLFDALECLVRKIGVSDLEITPDTGSGRIHLYTANGTDRMADNTPLSPASTLWSSVDKMKTYDLVLNSCEGGEYPAEKPQPMMDATKGYADAGGRLFNSHYHNVWITGEDTNTAHAPAVWPSIATCRNGGTGTAPGMIDQVDNPKGPAFASWMVNVGASQTLGVIPTTQPTNTCQSIDMAKTERWVYQGNNQPQMFQFTTPNEAIDDMRCGKVVFSDMHVSNDSNSGPTYPFPNGCSVAPLTAQEKALAFMFFDIASCVGPIN